jgi:threonylcarbamoyladenosine tRNA methylthiotransferase MtaB
MCEYLAEKRLIPYSVRMGPSLKTVTLGCKVNQYETQLVREGLQRAGYMDAAEEEPAQLCVVNTCTVTSEGDSKSRQAIRRLARENPDARIVVMGCYATRAPEELAALPNVVEVVTDKREIPDLLGRFGVVDIPTGISQFGSRHRAYIKVQDGCMLRCSYCIIPHVRPNLSSRPIEHVVDEVSRLTANGYHEIVLTGIHLGHYGVDENFKKPKEEWTRLSTLVRRLVQLPGDFRIRLSSIESTEVTRELIAVMADHPERVCPHLHVCLQSGSDSVLRRMRRRWSSRMFIDRCALLKETLEQPALTTDIIVGFPGETDADFEATLDVSRQVGFSKVHVFPFSARKGTPAAGYLDVVPDQVKKERVETLSRVEAELRRDYFASLVGRPLRMMVEDVDTATGDSKGTACRYATCIAKGAHGTLGSLLDVRVIASQEDQSVVVEPLFATKA